MGTFYCSRTGNIVQGVVKLHGKKMLLGFVKKHADAKKWIDNWVAEVEATDWQSPQDIVDRYNRVKLIKGNLFVFRVKGNRYRMAVSVAFGTGKVFMKQIGTHEQYDDWKLGK